MSTAPIALQLFAVRGEAERDLANTLKQVAAIGYQGAEPWGYDGESEQWKNHSAADIRKMFDDNGLACCGFHLAPGALIGDNLKRTAEFNRVLGNRFLIIAGDNQRMSSVDGITELAGILNSAAETVRDQGLFVGYHAHGFDAKNIDGEVAWYRLFKNTDKDVIMQLDVGNYASGGGDSIAALRDFPGRARTVHLKDNGGGPDSVIGEGKLDWKTIFELCDTLHPVEWYVVEEGSRDGNGFDVSRRSLESLRRMGR